MLDESAHYLLILAKAIPVSFAALLPVINPIGTAIILLSMTGGASDEMRRSLAKTIALNALLLSTIVLLTGSYLLSFFGISIPIVQAAGGFVLMSMGWKMLNQSETTAPEDKTADESTDPQFYAAKTFYPFTFPITVGPGCVAVILTLSAHTTHHTMVDTALGQAGAFIGMVGVSVVTYLCFAYSSRVTEKLGKNGTSVLMRLIAFIVVCIGAEISWTGIAALVKTLS